MDGAHKSEDCTEAIEATEQKRKEYNDKQQQKKSKEKEKKENQIL